MTALSVYASLHLKFKAIVHRPRTRYRYCTFAWKKKVPNWGKWV